MAAAPALLSHQGGSGAMYSGGTYENGRELQYYLPLMETRQLDLGVE